jgi:hypothetical protein
MAAKWAVCTFVWNLGFPVFAKDFEVCPAHAAGTLSVKVALIILGERNGDALATFKVAYFSNYVFKHRFLHTGGHRIQVPPTADVMTQPTPTMPTIQFGVISKVGLGAV